jgi:allantoinase
MDAELLVSGGTVVLPDGLRPASVAIDGGRIVAVVPAGDRPPTARDELDATGLTILPGVIDTHVHARDPSVDAREDFGTATAAAAAGGITTILEMPISTPSVHDADVFAARVAAVGPKAHVDYGLYGGAADDNAADVAGLAAAGVVGFKTFRTPRPVGREREFVGLVAESAEAYETAMRAVAATGLVGAVHAEDAVALREREQRLRAAGDAGPLSHARWRPPEVELGSVDECLAIAGRAGARIQVAHASLPEAVDRVTRARDAGIAATVETCPHYLFATVADLERHGPFAKINPPLRDEAAVAGLWERLRAGEIDVIGSDHSPFLVEEKAPFGEDLWSALPGAPGLEALLPLLLTAVDEGRLGLEQLAALTSGNAARIFGLRDKGAIRVGADADLAIVATDRPGTIDTTRWLTRSRGTAGLWHGRSVTAAVVSTIVRGRVVVRDRAFVGEPGWGRLVRPSG